LIDSSSTPRRGAVGGLWRAAGRAPGPAPEIGRPRQRYRGAAHCATPRTAGVRNRALRGRAARRRDHGQTGRLGSAGSLLLGGGFLGLLGADVLALVLLVLRLLLDARHSHAGDQDLGVGDQLGPLREGHVTGEQLVAVLGLVDVDLDLLGHVESVDQEGELLEVDEGDRRGDGLALHDDRDVDLDLLALADDDQVEVGQGALEGVALDVLDQGQMFGAVGDLQRQQRVGVAGGQRDVMAGQLQVDGVVAVRVQDGGDLAPGTATAGRDLTPYPAKIVVLLFRHGIVLGRVTRRSMYNPRRLGRRGAPAPRRSGPRRLSRSPPAGTPGGAGSPRGAGPGPGDRVVPVAPAPGRALPTRPPPPTPGPTSLQVMAIYW